MSKRACATRALKAILVLYLILSLFVSVWYNVDHDNAWSIANNRNGLLIAGIDHDGFWLLSPFCNWGDVFVFGVNFESGRIFSDGFDYFGEWNIR